MTVLSMFRRSDRLGYLHFDPEQLKREPWPEFPELQEPEAPAEEGVRRRRFIQEKADAAFLL
jgi:hypothetical protein